MPTYEYVCENCGRFEHFQKITEPALTECPTCGSQVKRLISKNVNVIFKGSGFYSTDNRSHEYVDKAKTDEARKNIADNNLPAPPVNPI